MNRMDRSDKSLAGGLLILIASVLAAIEQNRVAPIALALVVIGFWMAASAAITESLWARLDEPDDGASPRTFQCSVCGLEGHEPGDSECDGPHGGFVDPDCTQPCCAEANAKSVEAER
jgi:hypothetical protein